MQIEVPYNYDTNLLIQLQPYKDRIIFLYMNAYPEDCIHARMRLIPEMSRDVWEQHVYGIQEDGYPLAILLQSLEPLSDNILQYYINLNVKIFIVGNDVNAYKLKSMGAQTIICSITRQLSLTQLAEVDDIYDYIVAPLALNRNMYFLKKLPNRKKMVLLVNANCDMHCKYFYWHWHDPKGIGLPCPYKNGIKHPTFIPPADIDLFHEDIAHIKLQGREWDTTFIMRDVYAYYHKNNSTIPPEFIQEFNLEDKQAYYHMEE